MSSHFMVLEGGTGELCLMRCCVRLQVFCPSGQPPFPSSRRRVTSSVLSSVGPVYGLDRGAAEHKVSRSEGWWRFGQSWLTFR